MHSVLINIVKSCFLLSLVVVLGPREAAAVNLNTLRIIRSYAQSVILQCPTTFYSDPIDLTRVRWINEVNDFAKPDANVAITPSNLILTSQVSLPLSSQYQYISCGYVTNYHQYVRLGFWRLQYVGKNTFAGLC
jgi:hypothetical protein